MSNIDAMYLHKLASFAFFLLILLFFPSASTRHFLLMSHLTIHACFLFRQKALFEVKSSIKEGVGILSMFLV